MKESFYGPGVGESNVLDREIASSNTQHHAIGGLWDDPNSLTMVNNKKRSKYRKLRTGWDIMSLVWSFE